jgi:hypothetical protein
MFFIVVNLPFLLNIYDSIFEMEMQYFRVKTIWKVVSKKFLNHFFNIQKYIIWQPGTVGPTELTRSVICCRFLNTDPVPTKTNRTLKPLAQAGLPDGLFSNQKSQFE